jgi:hypothetical protein
LFKSFCRKLTREFTEKLLEIQSFEKNIQEWKLFSQNTKNKKEYLNWSWQILPSSVLKHFPPKKDDKKIRENLHKIFSDKNFISTNCVKNIVCSHFTCKFYFCQINDEEMNMEKALRIEFSWSRQAWKFLWLYKVDQKWISSPPEHRFPII